MALLVTNHVPIQARTLTVEAQLAKTAAELEETKQQKQELAQKLQQIQISNRHLMVERVPQVRGNEWKLITWIAHLMILSCMCVQAFTLKEWYFIWLASCSNSLLSFVCSSKHASSVDTVVDAHGLVVTGNA